MNMEPSSSDVMLITTVASSRHVQQKYWITVEPVVVAFFIAETLSSTVHTNLYLRQTCKVTLGFNETFCKQLTTDNESPNIHKFEATVQSHTTFLLMMMSIMESCLPALLSLFLGPWSDLYGRKPLLLWPLIGYSMSHGLWLAMSVIPNLPPSFFLLASLPIALSGGFISIISGLYSYISDVSSAETRSLRMGILDASLFFGLLVGTVSCPYLFKAAGHGSYITVFGVSEGCCLLGLIYCIFLLPESVRNTQAHYPCCCLGSGLFHWHYVYDVVQACCKKRPNHGRAKIFLIITALATCIFTMEGESSVSFLFVREKFKWTLTNYMTLGSVSISVAIIGMLLGTSIFSTRLKVPDAPLILFGYLTKIASAVVCAISSVSWFLYLASCVSVFGSLVGPLSRSMLTKIVPSEDVGKIFSLTSSAEAMVPLVSSTIYTFVYNATLVSFPGMFYLLSAAIFAFDFLLLLMVIVIQHYTLPTITQQQLSNE